MAEGVYQQRSAIPGQFRQRSTAKLKSIFPAIYRKTSPPSVVGLTGGYKSCGIAENSANLYACSNQINEGSVSIVEDTPSAVPGISREGGLRRVSRKASVQRLQRKATLSSISLRSLATKDSNSSVLCANDTANPLLDRKRRPHKSKSATSLSLILNLGRTRQGEPSSSISSASSLSTVKSPLTGSSYNTDVNTVLNSGNIFPPSWQPNVLSNIKRNPSSSSSHLISKMSPVNENIAPATGTQLPMSNQTRPEWTGRNRPLSEVLGWEFYPNKLLPRQSTAKYGRTAARSKVVDQQRLSSDWSGHVSSSIPSSSSSSSDQSMVSAQTSQSSVATATTKVTDRVMFSGDASLNNLFYTMRDAKSVNGQATSLSNVGLAQLEREFEAVLESRNVAPQQRAQMRTLKPELKAKFIQFHWEKSSCNNTVHSTSTPFLMRAYSGNVNNGVANPTAAAAAASIGDGGPATGTEKQKRRPRSRTFTFARGEWAKKRGSLDIESYLRTKNRSSNPTGKVAGGSTHIVSDVHTTPGWFIEYLLRMQNPVEVEVGYLHKLRILIRNESVEWVTEFILGTGMREIVELLERIMKLEWREDHEDQLLHQCLLCLKGLCTTDLALRELSRISDRVFPALLSMLFDPQHRGPSEFSTRSLIINILFMHLSAANDANAEERAMEILSYLKDPTPQEDEGPLPFIREMHQVRPYRMWCKEVTNVTKEVFWIFLHHLNIVTLPGHVNISEPRTFRQRFFPQSRPPVAAAPYVGGVEWDATNYISAHLDLMNGLIVSMRSREARSSLRRELKVSGWEKVMGDTLRLCKEKFYLSVHAGLRLWVAAGVEDGWDVNLVRLGGNEVAKNRTENAGNQCEEE